MQPLEAARGSWSRKLHLVACSTIYLSSSTTLERRKGRGRRRTKTGAPARTTPAVRQGKKYQQGASSSALRFVRERVKRCCLGVSPNHSGFTPWLCRQGQRYPGAVWTTELRLEPVSTTRAASRKAGYAGPGPRSGSFHGLSRRKHGRCRHVRHIGCACRLVGVKADIPVTTRDQRNNRSTAY